MEPEETFVQFARAFGEPVLSNPTLATCAQLDPAKFGISPVTTQQIGLAQRQPVLSIGLVGVSARGQPAHSVKTDIGPASP